jgi:uncharacterized protein (TIGR00251 family)
MGLFDGLTLAIKVTPRARHDAIGGWIDAADGKRLEIRLHAQPADGEANAALVKLLAKTFGLRQADVEIVQGGASRMKRVRLNGEQAALSAMLDRHLEGIKS